MEAAINKKLNSVVQMLEHIVDDKTVPRNIRRICLESIDSLKSDDEELSVRLNFTISNLDEVTNDPNIPMYTRTQIWNIVSILESIGNGE